MITQDTRLLKSFNVLLIGDSCIDEYKIGTVDRLSPEAPVPVIKLVEEYQLPGMAANVKENLLNLGIDPDFVTNNNQITKTRYIDKRSGQHLLRVDSEPTTVSWSGQTPYPIDSYDAVVISDYNKGFLSYEHIENIISKTNNPIFIDTKKQDLHKFSADHCYIKINEVEYKQRSSSSRNLIVTLGAQGAMLNQFEKETLFPTKNVEVVDVCGCGDTFLASLTYKFLETKNINDAIIFANKAASLTVQKQGNYAPQLKEIDARY